jgi:hypothetical protein
MGKIAAQPVASRYYLCMLSLAWVLAYVDESRAGNIRVDQAAEVRLSFLTKYQLPTIQRAITGAPAPCQRLR